jgi:serine/threonine protein kinase
MSENECLSIRDPGNLVEKYIKIKELGSGTFGKVYEIENKETKKKYACKHITKKKICDMNKFNNEINIMREINHPNIIKLYEIVETQNKFYLIMEYSEGGSLYNYITAARRIKEEKASFLFYQLIIGLKELHKNKICHRDLKPENLLLSSLLDNLKISDFGLSNFLPNNNLLSTKCGSPNYIAPEMITKKEYNGIFIDIWSCGIILYAMIFGFLPFDDEYYDDLFTKIKKGHVNFYHKDEFNISSDCIDLIKKILKVNPKDRISINDILKHPFINKFYTSFHLDNYLFGNNEKDIDNKIIDYMIKVLKIYNDSHFI